MDKLIFAVFENENDSNNALEDLNQVGVLKDDGVAKTHVKTGNLLLITNPDFPQTEQIEVILKNNNAKEIDHYKGSLANNG